MWNKIEKRLGTVEDRVPEEFWKHLKKYHLYGTPLPEFPNPWVDPAYIKILELWLQPNPVQVGKTIYSEDVGDIELLRATFDSFYRSMLPTISEVGDSRYGVMGGREQEIVLDLNRGIDPEELVDYGSGKLYKSSIAPNYLLSRCTVGTDHELISENFKPYGIPKGKNPKYVAYYPGVVLWDKLSQMMDRAPLSVYPNYIRKTLVSTDDYWDDDNVVNRRLKHCIRGVLTFNSRVSTDSAFDRENTTALVKSLIGKFENHEFSEPMMIYWNQFSS